MIIGLLAAAIVGAVAVAPPPAGYGSACEHVASASGCQGSGRNSTYIEPPWVGQPPSIGVGPASVGPFGIGPVPPPMGAVS